MSTTRISPSIATSSTCTANKKKALRILGVSLVFLMLTSSVATMALAESSWSQTRPEPSKPDTDVTGVHYGDIISNLSSDAVSDIGLVTQIIDYTHHPRDVPHSAGYDDMLVRIAIAINTRRSISYTSSLNYLAGTGKHGDGDYGPNLWYYGEPLETGINGGVTGKWFDLGFSFVYYGFAYTKVYVDRNGFLFLNATASPASIPDSPHSIPMNSTANTLIAAFWTNIDPSSGDITYWSGIDVTVQGASLDPNAIEGCNVFVATYTNVKDTATGQLHTFQIILRQWRFHIGHNPNPELTYHGDVLFSYQQLNAAGVSPVIGIQDQTGSRADTYSGTLSDGDCLLFRFGSIPSFASQLRIELGKSASELRGLTASASYQPDTRYGHNVVENLSEPVKNPDDYDRVGSSVIRLATYFFALLIGPYPPLGLIYGGVMLFGDMTKIWTKTMRAIPEGINYADFQSGTLERNQLASNNATIPCKVDGATPGEIWPTDCWLVVDLSWKMYDDCVINHHLDITASLDYVGTSGSGSISTTNTLDYTADTDSPSIGSPPDITYQTGTTGTGRIINWAIGDRAPGIYRIDRMFLHHNKYIIDEWEPVVPDTIWTQNCTISCNVDGMSMSDWIYSITVTDQNGNWRSDDVRVTVLGPPSISFTNPPGSTTMSGSISYTFHVSATDPVYGSSGITSVQMYCTDMNGQGYLPTWHTATHGSGSDWYYTFSISPDTTYEIGAKATNVLGGTGYATAIQVRVVPAPAFTYTQPSITVETGTSFTLKWTATSIAPTTYVITRGGTQVASGQWSSGVSIQFPTSLSSAGTYIYTMTVYDSYGGSATSSATVTAKVDAAPPTFTYRQSNFGTNINTPFTLKWTASDLHPNNYIITRNGAQVASGTWKSGTQITYSDTRGTSGTYTYTITVYDQCGNSASATCTVTIRNYQ